ncbi:MAG: hypothetical protein WCE62_15240 [Polyangiales bacterium]
MKRREVKRGIRLTGAEHEEILNAVADLDLAPPGLRSKAPHVEIFVPAPASSQPIQGSEKRLNADSNNAGRLSRSPPWVAGVDSIYL